MSCLNVTTPYTKHQNCALTPGLSRTGQQTTNHWEEIKTCRIVISHQRTQLTKHKNCALTTGFYRKGQQTTSSLVQISLGVKTVNI